MPIDKKFFDTKVEYPAQRDMFENIISFLKKNKNMAYSAHELSLETKIRYTTIQSLIIWFFISDSSPFVSPQRIF